MKKKKKGWISLNRSILEHWLYPTNEGLEGRKFTWFEAWVDLLFLVAHQETAVVIDKQTHTIDVGCMITNKSWLSERWKWNRQTVARFLKILEKEKMISMKKLNEKKRNSCTRLKVTNYKHYQKKNNSKRTQEQSQEHTSKSSQESSQEYSHNNNDNNYNNDNKREEYKKLYGTDDPYVLALKGIYPDD